jgi:hypothetical protein
MCNIRHIPRLHTQNIGNFQIIKQAGIMPRPGQFTVIAGASGIFIHIHNYFTFSWAISKLVHLLFPKRGKI